MLLTAHTPKILRLGPASRATLGKMDQEIKRDVCMLVGIAESINRMHPSYVTACMAIALAGDRFTERNEHQALFDILQKTENSYGWSTSVAQEHLKEAWGGNKERHYRYTALSCARRTRVPLFSPRHLPAIYVSSSCPRSSP